MVTVTLVAAVMGLAETVEVLGEMFLGRAGEKKD